MANPPNVVLVSIDSLRADHCGFLGDDRGLTPTMDALARSGVAFETAVAPGPQTFSSMPAVVTGRPRPRTPLEATDDRSHIEARFAAIDAHLDRYATLAERLRERGYATAGFSPNPWASSTAGFDRGFDTFRDLASQGTDGRLRGLLDRAPGIDASSKPAQLAADLLTGRSFFTRWTDYVEELEATRRALPEPYFLWVFLMDTHVPFLPARAHRTEQSWPGMIASAIRTERVMRGRADSVTPAERESMLRSYRDTVRSVDAFLDRLRTALDGEDARLIVHADHGESFGEHGNFGHHHRELYEENVHVPLLVSGGETATVSAPTSLAAIPAMAMSIARTGSVEPDAVTSDRAVTASECGTNRAVRGRRFKFHDEDGQVSLYDLDTDPGEACNVAIARPDRCAIGRATLARRERQAREERALSAAARRVAPLAEF